MARVVTVVAALVLVALALQPLPVPDPGHAPQMALSASVSGSLRLGNSLAGQPVVTAVGVIPGHEVGGIVKIKNVSRRKLRLGLVRRRLTDVAGPNGGRLSSVVELDVKRLRRKALHRGTVYRGRLGRMPRVDMGRVGPGNSRKYRFSLTFPDGGRPPSPTGGDNAYQASALSVDFVWLTGSP